MERLSNLLPPSANEATANASQNATAGQLANRKTCLPIRGRRSTSDSQGLRCLQPQHVVETNFGSTAQSYIRVFLTGARKDHVSDLVQELRLLAEAQQPHDFLRIYLLATPNRCTGLAAWFEETLCARHGVWRYHRR